LLLIVDASVSRAKTLLGLSFFVFVLLRNSCFVNESKECVADEENVRGTKKCGE
jgi:hypothetical protein